MMHRSNPVVNLGEGVMNASIRSKVFRKVSSRLLYS